MLFRSGDALDEIIKMRQGNATIEDHVARFKVLLADSGVTEDSPAALDYFKKSIRVPLLKRILDHDNVPETLDEWYRKALKVDNDYHKVQRIIRRDAPKKDEGKPRWNFRKERDDSAMDVDVITKVYKKNDRQRKNRADEEGTMLQVQERRSSQPRLPRKEGKNHCRCYS